MDVDSDGTQTVTRSIAAGSESLGYSAGRRGSYEYDVVATFTCVADKRRLGLGGGGGREEQGQGGEQRKCDAGPWGRG